MVIFAFFGALHLGAADSSGPYKADSVERELAAKLVKAGQWAAAVHGGLYSQRIEQYLQTTVRQLKGDLPVGHSLSLASDRGGLVTAGILLASVIKGLADKTPDLQEAIQMGRMESIHQKNLSRFIWSLLKAVYEDSRFEVRSETDLNLLAQNLSAAALLDSEVEEAEEIFVSLYMKGFKAAQKWSPVFKGRSTLSAERAFLKATGVPSKFADALRLSIIKHLGERMDYVDYSPERAHDSDDFQREAVVREVFDLAELAFVPHQAESIVSPVHRRDVLRQMISAFRSSETELSSADVEIAKSQVFPQDRIPDAQRFWEMQLEVMFLELNVDIASRSRTSLSRSFKEIYDRLRRSASERLLARAQIPTVASGMDLVLQMYSATHAWKELESDLGLSREDRSAYGDYLLNLWIERAQDLLKERVAYDSEELLRVPHALTDILRQFPEAQSLKASLRAAKGIVDRLMRASIYVVFDRASSAEDLLQGLWSLDYGQLLVPGVVSPQDFKSVQRQIMMELVSIFRDLKPSDLDWVEYVRLYASSEYQGRDSENLQFDAARLRRAMLWVAPYTQGTSSLWSQILDFSHRGVAKVQVSSRRMVHWLRPPSTYQQLILSCHARVAGLKK